MEIRNKTVFIPSVTRDDRIGSVFNQLFYIIHETEKGGRIWNFKNDTFLHPFFLAPLAIFKDTCTYKIECTGMCDHIKSYLGLVHFEQIYDASNLKDESELGIYYQKSYIPISRFLIKNKNIDNLQEVLQRVIEVQSGLPDEMRTPLSSLLSELVGNIGEHSESKYGYLFCQRIKNDLYLIICDRGKTIYNSYVDSDKYLDMIGLDEAKAVMMANDGYSTKDLPESSNRGYGISKSRSMIVNGFGGAFFMLSGTAFYRHSLEGINVVNIPEEFRWDGTIVLMRIPTSVPSDFNFYDYVE